MQTLGVLCGMVIFAPVAGAAGQESGPPELVTDRPDITESSVAVSPGLIQLELGAEAARDADGRSLTGPNLLVRYGMIPGLELRLGVPSYGSVTSSDGERQNGWGDVEIGAKWARPFGRRWAAGVIPFATLSTGSGAYRDEAATAGVVGTWSVELGERFDLSGNTGAAWMRGVPGPGWTQTLSLGAGVSERIGTFVEIFAEKDPRAAVRPFADLGATWLLTPTLQLDTSAGVGFGAASESRFFGVGLSIRR